MLPVDGHRAGWDGHVLLIFASERERRAGVAAWARQGLEAGAKIIYVEPADEPTARSFIRLLSNEQVDASGALARGQLEVVDPATTALGPSWQSAVVEAGLGAGFPTVRVGGEVSSSLRALSPADHADAESAADLLCRTRPVSMLCQCAADVVEPGALETLCALHADGIRGPKLRTSPTADGIALAGEIDLSNKVIVRSVLAAECDHREQERESVVVDLRLLNFIDTAGARALLTGTMSYRQQRGIVRLRAAQPTVGRLLHLLGVHHAEGIVLEGGS